MGPTRRGRRRRPSRAPCPSSSRTGPRRHVSLELTGTRVRVVDQGSKNGTRYQGARFTRLELPVGATVELGNTSLALLPLLAPAEKGDRTSLGGMVGRAPVSIRPANRVVTREPVSPTAAR